MLIDLLLVAAGLVLLIFAGDALVRGAVSLALKLGIPALIVSLTIVAFGTSAPEMLVAVQSALEGAPGIAFGNVVGSNIANVLLVLGLPAVLAGIDTHLSDTRRTYSVMLAVSVLFIVLCATGPFDLVKGVFLLAVLALVLGDALYVARCSRKGVMACDETVDDIPDADPHMAGWKISCFMLGGVIGLPLGAHLLIEGSVGIARTMGVSETIIGLTIVAIGTSLPELATSVVAALKRQSDVALGNVIGSNIFNVLAIMGVASFFGPLAVPPELLTFDLWVMLLTAILLFPFVYSGWRISKLWGVAFVSVYALYVGVLIL